MSMLSESRVKVKSRMWQGCVKFVYNSCQSCLKVVLKLSQSCFKVCRLSQNWTRATGGANNKYYFNRRWWALLLCCSQQEREKVQHCRACGKERRDPRRVHGPAWTGKLWLGCKTPAMWKKHCSATDLLQELPRSWTNSRTAQQVASLSSYSTQLLILYE